MKLKNKPRLLKDLAKNSNTPSEFIRYVMALQNQTANDVVANTDITRDHFYVILNGVDRGVSSIGSRLCLKIAQGLDIDPYILAHTIADYNINCMLNCE